jgi:hypothetical protein
VSYRPELDGATAQYCSRLLCGVHILTSLASHARGSPESKVTAGCSAAEMLENQMMTSEMGGTAGLGGVSTGRTCASAATPAMDSAPWSIWAWLADSTGTTGTTGTASPSPVAWNLKGNDITISLSGRDSESLTSPLPLLPVNNDSGPGLLSALPHSTDSSAFGSASAPPKKLLSSFLVLETEQDRGRTISCCRTVTPGTCHTDTTNNITNTPNPTNTGATSSSSPISHSFLLCSPSTLSFDAAVENNYRSRRLKMPGSILGGPVEPYLSSLTYNAATTTAQPSQWRPHTSRSGRSARSASPLFIRWARRQHQQQLEVPDLSDSISSSGRKSTSSSGHSKRDPGYRDNVDNASHKHTYNFSTSTVSRPGSRSRRHSQSGLPPPLTREEFEALPLAIQRKVRTYRFLLSHCTFGNYLTLRTFTLFPLAKHGCGHRVASALRCDAAPNGNSCPLHLF